MTPPGSGGSTTYFYEDTTVKVTDAAGKWKKYETDAFGNLVKVWEPNPAGQRQYNTRGQLTRQTGMGVDLEYRFSSTANDGRLWQRKDWVSGEEVTYQYDQLGRLIAAETTDAAWGQSYVYDGFGNLTQQTVTKGTAPSMSITVDQNTNRLIGTAITYDLSGNMSFTNTSVQSMSYDVQNRLTMVTISPLDTENYFYSARNERIVVKRKSNWAMSTLEPSEEVNFYGADGLLLGVYRIEQHPNNQSGWKYPVRIDDKERVYFGGRLIAMGSGPGGTQVIVTDRLGSVVKKGTQTYRYYPYGQEIGAATANDTAKYATYTRDSWSGLDYAMNRFYKNEWGRFTSPDPYQASGGVSDPGSWNRYAYVGGDPVNFNDPSGLCAESVNTPGYSSVTVCESAGIISTFMGTRAVLGDGMAMSDVSAGYGEQGEPLSGSYVVVVPKVPVGNNYTSVQIQALTGGLINALTRTDQPNCAVFFAGGDEDPSSTLNYVLQNTTYRLLPLPQGSGIGAQTAGPADVHINTAGAFFNSPPNGNGTVTVWMPDASGVSSSFTFGSMATLQGFMLLHELGHQLEVFGPDTNPSVNGVNSKGVLDHCFEKDAQGVYR